MVTLHATGGCAELSEGGGQLTAFFLKNTVTFVLAGSAHRKMKALLPIKSSGAPHLPATANNNVI